MKKSNLKADMKRSIADSIRASLDGIVEGYYIVWDTVDSYNTSFKRGCTLKTTEGRTDKIRLLWDHGGDPIGKILELREDSHGAYVKAKLSMGIESVRDKAELINDKAIDCLSFRFGEVQSSIVDGILTFSEINIAEISPVVFEANNDAKITGIRAKDFNETDYKNELNGRGYRLIDSLNGTLSDINWAEGKKTTLARNAIIEFNNLYISWLKEMADNEIEYRCDNELVNAFNKFMGDDTLDNLALNSSFSANELRTLKAGKTINKDVSSLDSNVNTEHKKLRFDKMESVFAELRNGLSPAETMRIRSLLDRQEKPEPAKLDILQKINDNLKTY